MLQTYPDEVEADLARFYGLDIADYWRGTLSARRVWTLVTHLPEDAATAKAQRGNHWSEQMYLLAHLVDVVAFHRAEWANSHGAKLQPTPVTRPGDIETAHAEREQSKGLHDALRDMMTGGVPVLALPAGTAGLRQPAEDIVR